MRKLKTKSSIAKRFKKTGTNKFVRRQAFKSHILTKKSKARKKRLSRALTVKKADSKKLQRILVF